MPVLRHLRPVHLLAVALLSGCAAGNAPVPGESMPAARAGLHPEYRIFYDALQGYGDWLLIEPYGFVFRPLININDWRPYSQGFWAPSDVYGWTWISAEPFGWATYHYGRWMYDRFQGWVWIPGADWGPAWVDWQQAGDYVGWSPLMASSAPSIPGGAYAWVPMSQLAVTDVHAHVVTSTQLGTRVEDARPIQNTVERGGITFNRGPTMQEVERHTGPLLRVHIDDAVPAPTPGTNGGAARPAPVDVTRRAAADAASEAGRLVKVGAPAPARLKLVRPIGVPGRRAPAAADSTH